MRSGRCGEFNRSDPAEPDLIEGLIDADVPVVSVRASSRMNQQQ
jgi:hypothetical protein